jgi:hypothetical protein
MDLEIKGEDIIQALTQQRNAALDEIARQAAIIKALERRLQASAPIEINADPP